jgi:hypothetical protein
LSVARVELEVVHGRAEAVPVVKRNGRQNGGRGAEIAD